MKDDTSTPTEGSAPNEFERGKPGTNARSEAEAAIEDLRQRGGVFVNAVRATRMPMALTDPNLPGNPIVFANSSFLKLSGYSMDEVLGQQPHFMNGPGTDPNDARRFEEAIRSDQDDIVETVQYRKDGGRFVATVLTSAFKDDEGHTLNHFMSWLDVTRRVDAEDEVDDLKKVQSALQETAAALRASEDRRVSALLAADMGTWDYDLVADVCHFDARAQEMYNLPSDQLDHRPEGVASVVHPDDVGPLFDEIQRASDPDGEGRYDMVYRIARGDGTYRWLRAVGITEFEGTGKARRAVRIVGASRDITQEREAEAALRASEERFAQFAASTTDVLWIRDADTMALEYISPAFESVFGVTTGAVEGGIEPGAGLIDPADRERVIAHLEAARRGEPQIYEFRIVHGSNGGPRWIRDHCFPLIDETGGVQRIGGIARDVTELRLADEERRASEARQAFLLKLSDALRPLADAAAIQSATARLLGEHLGADRSMYAEVEGEQGFETGTIRGQYVRRGELDAALIQPFPDHFTFADFGGHTMAQRYRGEPLVVSDIDSEPGFEPEEREAWRAANVRAALVIELVKEGRLVAEFGVHSATAREWTDADISLMTDVAERTWAAAERARAEVAVRENERLRTAMLDVLPLGLGMMDSDGNVLLSNTEWSRFIPTKTMPSRDPERAGRWRSWDENGEPVQPVNFPGARALRGESVVPPVEFLYEADDGKEIWTSVASVPLIDADGSVTGAVTVVQDIDTAKRATEALQASERHSKLLLAELQHRVRNTLAIVRSIAQRTAENSNSVDEMLGHFRGRLDAFSRVQAALTRSVGGTVSLVGLVEDELVAHAAREGEKVSLDGPDIMLEPKTAERLSLAIHELTTNAVKHGALTKADGRIQVRWKREQSNGSARLLLNWKESGVEVDDKPEREGFGMELLRRSLPYDLQAETKVELKRQGLEFHLDMPLIDPVDIS